MVFAFVSCDDSSKAPEEPTYSIEAKSPYAILEDGKATIEATLKGSDGTETVKTYEVTKENLGYYEIKEKGATTVVFVGDIAIDSPEVLGSFVQKDSVANYGVITKDITLEGGTYLNDDSMLFGTSDVSLNVSKDTTSGQGIIIVSANNITLDGFTVNYVGTQKESEEKLTTKEHLIKVTDVMDSHNPPTKVTLQNITLNLENKAEDGKTYSCAGLNLHGVKDATCKNITINGKSSKTAMQVASAENLLIDNPLFEEGSWGYLGFMWADNNDFYTDSTVTLANTENLPSFYVEGPEYFELDGVSSYTKTTVLGKDVYKLN